MWSIHIIEHYSAIKRNGALTHVTIGMNLENITLRERSRSQKTAGYRIPFIRKFQKRPGAGGSGKWGITINRHTIFFFR